MFWRFPGRLLRRRSAHHRDVEPTSFRSTKVDAGMETEAASENLGTRLLTIDKESPSAGEMRAPPAGFGWTRTNRAAAARPSASRVGG